MYAALKGKRMKKKLLFINGHMDTGGTEKALLDILKNLDYDRCEVDLLLTEHLGDYAEQLPPQVNVRLRSIESTYGPLMKVIVTSVRNRDWFSLKMRFVFLATKLFGQKWFSLAKKMLTGRATYDCVISFRNGFCSQIAAYAANAKRRITWWHHGEVYVEKNSYLEYALLFDRVAVVSDACRRMMAEAFPALADKMVTIPNMLDVSDVQAKAGIFDPYPEKDRLHLVSVGRLSPEKHFENAVFAASQLKERGIPFRWHLVGDGPLREELEQAARAANVTDCFVFEGNQVNPYPYIKQADLFVHPSYVESFGIVITEALALGVPCVVTKSLGVMDFLADGKNALLAEQDPNDLAEKVLRLITDTALRAHLKDNAHCPERFLPAAIIQKIEKLLEAEE